MKLMKNVSTSVLKATVLKKATFLKNTVALMGIATFLGTGCVTFKVTDLDKVTLQSDPYYAAPKPNLIVKASGMPGNLSGAIRIMDATQLMDGPAAKGRVGDYLLFNDFIKVAISDAAHYEGRAWSGGNIIDADVIPAQKDQFGQLITRVEKDSTRHIVYDRVFVTRNGSDGGYAEVAASGVDSKDPMIIALTRYQLVPHTNYIRIITELTNTGGGIVENYEVGDFVEWGEGFSTYLPGIGTSASTSSEVSWIASLGKNASYGLATAGSNLDVKQVDNGNQIFGTTLTIPRGSMVSYSRYFVVGKGDVASVTLPIYRIQRISSATVFGQAVESGSKKPLLGVKIEAVRTIDEKPISIATTDKNGNFVLPLPLDLYSLTVSTTGESSSEPKSKMLSLDTTQGKSLTLSIEM